MNQQALATSPISASLALSAVETDAIAAYRDLSPFRVEVRLEDDGWHVDYELKDATSNGGGPHYVVDADDGRILRKRYEQ
jgi:hypothetical protein